MAFSKSNRMARKASQPRAKGSHAPAGRCPRPYARFSVLESSGFGGGKSRFQDSPLASRVSVMELMNFKLKPSSREAPAFTPMVAGDAVRCRFRAARRRFRPGRCQCFGVFSCTATSSLFSSAGEVWGDRFPAKQRKKTHWEVEKIAGKLGGGKGCDPWV